MALNYDAEKKQLQGVFQGQTIPLQLETDSIKEGPFVIAYSYMDDLLTMEIFFDPNASEELKVAAQGNHITLIQLQNFSINGISVPLPNPSSYKSPNDSPYHRPIEVSPHDPPLKNDMSAYLWIDAYSGASPSYSPGPDFAFWSLYDAPNTDLRSLYLFPQQYGCVTRTPVSDLQRKPGESLVAYLNKHVDLSTGNLPTKSTTPDFYGSIDLSELREHSMLFNEGADPNKPETMKIGDEQKIPGNVKLNSLLKKHDVEGREYFLLDFPRRYSKRITKGVLEVKSTQQLIVWLDAQGRYRGVIVTPTDVDEFDEYSQLEGTLDLNSIGKKLNIHFANENSKQELSYHFYTLACDIDNSQIDDSQLDSINKVVITSFSCLLWSVSRRWSSKSGWDVPKLSALELLDFPPDKPDFQKAIRDFYKTCGISVEFKNLVHGTETD